ncbi:phosphotransferase family protein [Myxococcota bacterium]|nr:phosphotransferase family protein [Myxococcota bacterium]
MTKPSEKKATLDDLASGLCAWVERSTDAEVIRAEPHVGGNHRIAWQVDVGNDSRSSRDLFLTLDAPDAGGDGGNARDAAVLAALAETSIPVPKLVARDGPGGALLMERVMGHSDAPQGEDLEPVMGDLMRQMVAIHRVRPEVLAIPEFSVPSTPEGLALDQLKTVESNYLETPEAHHPIVDFGLGWLRRNVPRNPDGPVLVHADIGPGNVIYADGVIRAIVDWEISHWGDPVEDLATLSVRDMSTPVGSLKRRLAQYEVELGGSVDLDRFRYYRALVLVRNSLLICLTLAKTAVSDLPPQLEAFALLLRRAAAQALAEASRLPFVRNDGLSPASIPDLPTGSLENDEVWIPALAAHAQADCSKNRDLMGPLANCWLQAVPES